MIIPDTFTFEYDTAARRHIVKKISSASANAAKFGVQKCLFQDGNRGIGITICYQKVKMNKENCNNNNHSISLIQEAGHI